jgi:hypothetical protein
MAANLDKVFAGVTLRRAMNGNDDLVDHSVAVEKLADVLDVRLKPGRFLLAAKDTIDDRNRFRP